MLTDMSRCVVLSEWLVDCTFGALMLVSFLCLQLSTLFIHILVSKCSCVLFSIDSCNLYVVQFFISFVCVYYCG